MPLKAFRPQFDGLINLFKLAIGHPDPPKLLYISSISSVAQLLCASESHFIPEEVTRDFDASYNIGYAKSKLLSELLCDKAARHLDIAITFVRVGQIAGPVAGKTLGPWNVQGRFPSLILTSIGMGSISDDLGSDFSKVDWVPVEILSRTLVELGMNREEGGRPTEEEAEALNLVNPRTIPWKELLPSFVSSIEKRSNKQIDIISLESWLNKLRTLSEGLSVDATELARTYPGIKLQDFYEAFLLNGKEAVEWEIKHATAKSKTLREIPTVGNEWFEKWMEGWVPQIKP